MIPGEVRYAVPDSYLQALENVINNKTPKDPEKLKQQISWILKLMRKTPVDVTFVRGLAKILENAEEV